MRNGKVESIARRVRSIFEMKNHRILRWASPLWRRWMAEGRVALNENEREQQIRNISWCISIDSFGFGGFWCFRTYELVFAEPGAPVIVIDDLDTCQCFETINIHDCKFSFCRVPSGVRFRRIELQSAGSNWRERVSLTASFDLLRLRWNSIVASSNRRQVAIVGDGSRPFRHFYTTLLGSNLVFDFY